MVPGFSLEIDLVGDGYEKFLKEIRALTWTDSQKTRLMKNAGELIRLGTVQAFTNPAYRATAWPPLKKPKGADAKLYRTGALKQSIEIKEVSPTSVSVGSDRVYAAVHQLGGGNNIPARPYFPFRDDGTMLPIVKERVDALMRNALSVKLPE